MRVAYLVPFLSPLVRALAPPQSYVNTAIARTVDLGGATTHLTTQYNIKATANSPGEYWLALAGEDDEEPAWWEVTVGGKVVEGRIVASEKAPTVAVPLGELKKGDAVTLSLTSLLTHTSSPLPETIEQRDAQYLLWRSNSTYVDSWYTSDVERIKLRAPTPNILSYSNVPSVYTRDSTTTKSASTVTLGPFHSVPPTLGGDSQVEQPPFQIHYEANAPIIQMRTLRRLAEVSHWGGNLNIQDEVELFNMGPKLKGHFSRLAHQQSKFHASTPPQILTDLTFRLPPLAHTPYFYDTIGNVSTSHFRPGSTPASKGKFKSPRVVDSVLELRPRYPLLGGWNYSYTVGWDMPLEEALKGGADGKKVLAVPFMLGNRDMIADHVELNIILPEGARDVEVFTPFRVDSIEHSSHSTYLDSTGRHAITLKKARCTENHAVNVYVTYTYPLSAQLQKPFMVSAVVGGLFILAMGLRRIDIGIEKKRK
ncbi:oligosaccharyltransferase complex subunit alpha (ribophorin I), partial [Tremellales sp. Uapishka_1]